MRGLLAPLVLVAARARRRPGRWLLPALGIALTAAFAGTVAGEATIASDQSARSALEQLSPLERAVRVSWQGVVTSGVARQARGVLHALGFGPATEVVLLNPVRLSGIVVRPAAIAPLGSWAPGKALGACRPRDCPMLLAGGALARSTLTAAGVSIRVIGSARLASAAPLGFSPTATSDSPPVLLTGDVAGLDGLEGLSGVYRSHSWVVTMASGALRSWQLSAFEARLAHAQAGQLANDDQFTLDGPFDGLDQARAAASAAPPRLLLAGGGALTAIALFLVLAAGSLRRDQGADLERLRNAGAHLGQWVVFAVGESAWLCAVALLAGAGLAVALTILLADGAGEPVGGVLAHSLLTPAAAGALLVGWAGATALLILSLAVRGTRVADLLGLAGAAALALALTRGPTGDTGNDPLAILLAPLACLAAGVITFRIAAGLLRFAERIARRGPVLARLALVGLARAPGSPSLAIAFVAVSIGLGGFALSYRATLLRGTADQAADQAPLDAVVSPGIDFTTPLQLAPLERWREFAAGTVLPVRRTEATYTTGAGTVTVPALGVPAAGLKLLHGWRSSDGSAPLRDLAARLQPHGPVRVPGPLLPPGARWLSVRVASPELAVAVTADLRDPGGAVRQLALGNAGSRPHALQARIPPGTWELEALELDEPAGLEITNGHQNAENSSAATQFAARMVLGPVTALAASREALRVVALGSWHGVGAATSVGRARAMPAASVRFGATGVPGLLRPLQPSDVRPLPVLVDPATAVAAGPGGRLALTVDQLPVAAVVVGVLRRFPTTPSDAAGFVIADESTVASALDAELPGQGRADELWISTPRPQALRRALATERLGQLDSVFRADVERQLRDAPVARAVLGTLIGAAALTGVLAVLGLLVALIGGARDVRVERDLEAQGLGPRGLRTELRARLSLTGAAGVIVGLLIAAMLTRLAVAVVRAAGAAAVPRPALVTVAPWGGLFAWGVAAIAVLALAIWMATRALVGR